MRTELRESFRPGDVVYARSEFDPAGKVEVKAVEEVFVRYAGILALHAGGQVVRTTGEHPFYERDRGRTACQELQPGGVSGNPFRRRICVKSP